MLMLDFLSFYSLSIIDKEKYLKKMKLFPLTEEKLYNSLCDSNFEKIIYLNSLYSAWCKSPYIEDINRYLKYKLIIKEKFQCINDLIVFYKILNEKLEIKG